MELLSVGNKRTADNNHQESYKLVTLACGYCDSCSNVHKPWSPENNSALPTEENKHFQWVLERFLSAKGTSLALGCWCSFQFIPHLWSRTYSGVQKEIVHKLGNYLNQIWQILQKLVSDYYWFHWQGKNPQQNTKNEIWKIFPIQTDSLTVEEMKDFRVYYRF